MKLIDHQNICHLEGALNYTVIHLADGKKEIYASTLKHYEYLLADSKNFVRIHKSFIINCDFIKEVKLKPQSTVILQSGVELPIARRRKIGMILI